MLRLDFFSKPYHFPFQKVKWFSCEKVLNFARFIMNSSDLRDAFCKMASLCPIKSPTFFSHDCQASCETYHANFFRDKSLKAALSPSSSSRFWSEQCQVSGYPNQTLFNTMISTILTENSYSDWMKIRNCDIDFF